MKTARERWRTSLGVTRKPAPRPSDAWYVIPVAGGIAVLTVGAILTFAVTGSVRGLDLHIVGAILMLASAAMLLLPLLIRGRSSPRRWTARSRQDVIDDGGDGSQTHMEPPHRDHPSTGDRRTRWPRQDRRWTRGALMNAITLNAITPGHPATPVQTAPVRVGQADAWLGAAAGSPCKAPDTGRGGESPTVPARGFGR